MNEAIERPFIEQSLNLYHETFTAAVYQPLTHLVEQVLASLLPGYSGSGRAYRAGIGLFLQYLESHYRPQIPPEVINLWCPFAEKTTSGRRTLWCFRPPVVILRWVSPAILNGFITWRTTVGDSPNTITVRVSAIKTLMGAAYEAGVVDGRQVAQLGLRLRQRWGENKSQPQLEPVGRWLTKAEVHVLRGIIDTSTNRGKRDVVLLDCFLYLGVRSDELRSVMWGNFEMMSGNWWCTLNHPQPFKQRRLKVHPLLRLSLLDWFAAIDFWQEPTCTPLCLNINRPDIIGRRVLTTEAIEMILNQYGALACIALPKETDRLTPTILRRTCGRNAYTNGASLKQVQNLLGHSSLDLTADFINAFDIDNQTAVDYLHYY